MKGYKVRDEVEYNSLITIIKNMGFKFAADFKWDPKYSFMSLCERFGYIQEYNHETKDLVFLPLSEFFAILEKYRKFVKIGNDVVEYHKGYIKVGCTTINNDLVRNIANDLID